MNKVNLVGRLTADPELRQTQNGVSSCRFTLAVDRRFKDKNSGEKQADFISCVAWKQSAEFISRYFNKGKMIAIVGELRTGKFQDRNHADVTHYTTDVFVESAEFCGDSGNNANNGSQPPPNNGYQKPPQNNQSQGNAPYDDYYAYYSNPPY